MGYMCDFCGSQRSMVYCRPDAACLCLSCDRHVHSANSLSRRHSRTLLCERCNSQPAFVRCAEERSSLCQNCDWMGHGASTSTSTHKRQNFNCYSGCPSAVEFSTIWSFVLDIPAVDDSSCEHRLGLMSINKNCVDYCLAPAEINSSRGVSATGRANDPQNLQKSSAWLGPLSLPQPSSARENVKQAAVTLNATLPKLPCPGTKGPGNCKHDGLYEDLNMDEVDLDFESYEELFGVALSHSKHLLENCGIGSLFLANDMSGSDSICQGAFMAEI